MKKINIFKNKYRYAADHKIAIDATVASDIQYNMENNKYNFTALEKNTNNLIRCTIASCVNYNDIKKMKKGENIKILCRIKKRKYIRSEKIDIIDVIVVDMI